jgi:hypothetical protein
LVGYGLRCSKSDILVMCCRSSRCLKIETDGISEVLRYWEEILRR